MQVTNRPTRLIASVFVLVAVALLTVSPGNAQRKDADGCTVQPYTCFVPGHASAQIVEDHDAGWHGMGGSDRVIAAHVDGDHIPFLGGRAGYLITDCTLMGDVGIETMKLWVSPLDSPRSEYPILMLDCLVTGKDGKTSKQSANHVLLASEKFESSPNNTWDHYKVDLTKLFDPSATKIHLNKMMVVIRLTQEPVRRNMRFGNFEIQGHGDAMGPSKILMDTSSVDCGAFGK